MFAARLFGPGVAPGGEQASVAISADTLVVISAVSGARHIPLATLTVRVAGFDRHGFECAWSDNGAWSCQVLDRVHANGLAAALPSELRDSLGRAQRGARRQHAAAWLVFGLLVGAPLLLMGLFLLFHQQFVDAVAAHVSPRLERQLGDSAFAQIATTTTLITDGSMHGALERIAARVTPDSRHTYRFHLVDDDSVNAFALPGGIIVVHTGLIAATARPEELAGVLAHEIQHVELRHSLKAVLRAAGLSLLWSLIAGDVGSTLAGQAADQLLSLKFSRDAEREADAAGFDLLVERGIDPRGMVSFFATLARHGDTAPPALLSTHPASEAREAALAAQVANLARTCCPPLAGFATWPPRQP